MKTKTPVYLDDFEVGDTFEFGRKEVTREEIIRFATEFDPQPFHLDEEAAKATVFKGLIASGWHTASMCMRMMVDGLIGRTRSMGSPGVDTLRWLKPVRPGDVLRVRAEVLELLPSRSSPTRGSIRVRYDVANQASEVVMSMVALGMMERRPGAGGAA